ncbi:MAG: hypothetical protein ABI068_14155, partial [Ktedonobacterales bacterium]
TEIQVDEAQVQLEAAYAELAAATAEAAATLGVGSPAVAAAEAQVMESQAQLAEAQAQRVAAIGKQDEAKANQQTTFDTTERHYQQASDDFARSLKGAQAPLEALAANGTNPLIDIAMPASGRSTFVPGATAIDGAPPASMQSTFTSCGSNAANNVFTTFGRPMSEIDAIGATGTVERGTAMDGIANGLNQGLAQNPGTAGEHIPADLLASGQPYASRSNVSLDALTQATSGGSPAVLSIRNPAGGMHAITVDSIKDGIMTYRDPLTGLTYQAPESALSQLIPVPGPPEQMLPLWDGRAVMLASVRV